MGVTNRCFIMFTLGVYFENLGLTETKVFLSLNLKSFVIRANLSGVKARWSQ